MVQLHWSNSHFYHPSIWMQPNQTHGLAGYKRKRLLQVSININLGCLLPSFSFQFNVVQYIRSKNIFSLHSLCASWWSKLCIFENIKYNTPQNKLCKHNVHVHSLKHSYHLNPSVWRKEMCKTLYREQKYGMDGLHISWPERQVSETEFLCYRRIYFRNILVFIYFSVCSNLRYQI